MDKIASKTTIFSYLALAAFPLMKANINSIFIIICCLFTLYDFLKNKKKIIFNPKVLVLTLVFWMFLFYEILSLSLDLKNILLHLPFLVLPLLFVFKPNYINLKVKEYSLLVFQGSVIVQSLLYLVVFLQKHSINSIFYIDNYNIPLFRTYVLENTSLDIHPTYFSAFLLFSLTISLFNGLKKVEDKNMIFHVANIIITTFLIFVFISKIIVIILALTILLYIFFELRNNRHFIKTLFVFIFLGGSVIFCFKNLIKKRFNEVRTEINRPLVGDYHNSINIRVAIFKCSIDLLKNAPIFGYGSHLQNKLNNCYKNNNDSNFYLISVYNTHNYYLNLILYGGWFFFLAFLYYIYYLIFKQNYPLLIIIFIVQVLLINLTENFLSRHHGIVLFIYFISLFLNPKNIFRKHL
ncbi:MAG: O-antigen ligase family protein [Flavobacteriaceae bacterium]|nr:O-antigen ligase family protein [Flavobacteriaceae bacterium]